MSILKQRFLLVSDMHYTAEDRPEELKEKYPSAIGTLASGDAFGKTQSEKIEKIYSDICAEHARSPLTAVLVLGDLSVDDYGYRNLPHNYCKRFKNECMDRLHVRAYALPGNHDSYPAPLWQKVFGYGRQYSLEFGETVFIMADTFSDTPASKTDPAGGSPHTKIDDAFLTECLRKYQNKKIFLCAHHFDVNKTFSEDAKRSIRENTDIVCLFRGHTHVNSVNDTGTELGNKKLVDIGGYGYCGKNVNGTWEFNIFEPAWAWGYQIAEIYDDRIKIYHVRTANNYRATNGSFQVPETVSDVVEYNI